MRSTQVQRFTCGLQRRIMEAISGLRAHKRRHSREGSSPQSAAPRVAGRQARHGGGGAHVTCATLHHRLRADTPTRASERKSQLRHDAARHMHRSSMRCTCEACKEMTLAAKSQHKTDKNELTSTQRQKAPPAKMWWSWSGTRMKFGGPVGCSGISFS